MDFDQKESESYSSYMKTEEYEDVLSGHGEMEIDGDFNYVVTLIKGLKLENNEENLNDHEKMAEEKFSVTTKDSEEPNPKHVILKENLIMLKSPPTNSIEESSVSNYAYEMKKRILGVIRNTDYINEEEMGKPEVEKEIITFVEEKMILEQIKKMRKEILVDKKNINHEVVENCFALFRISFIFLRQIKLNQKTCQSVLIKYSEILRITAVFFEVFNIPNIRATLILERVAELARNKKLEQLVVNEVSRIVVANLPIPHTTDKNTMHYFAILEKLIKFVHINSKENASKVIALQEKKSKESSIQHVEIICCPSRILFFVCFTILNYQELLKDIGSSNLGKSLLNCFSSPDGDHKLDIFVYFMTKGGGRIEKEFHKLVIKKIFNTDHLAQNLLKSINTNSRSPVIQYSLEILEIISKTFVGLIEEYIDSALLKCQEMHEPWKYWEQLILEISKRKIIFVQKITCLSKFPEYSQLPFWKEKIDREIKSTESQIHSDRTIRKKMEKEQEQRKKELNEKKSHDKESNHEDFQEMNSLIRNKSIEFDNMFTERECSATFEAIEEPCLEELIEQQKHCILNTFEKVVPSFERPELIRRISNENIQSRE